MSVSLCRRVLAGALAGAALLTAMAAGPVEARDPRPPTVSVDRAKLYPGQTVTLSISNPDEVLAALCIETNIEIFGPYSFYCTPAAGAEFPVPYDMLVADYPEVEWLELTLWTAEAIAGYPERPVGEPFDTARVTVISSSPPSVKSLTRDGGRVIAVADPPTTDHGSAVTRYQARCKHSETGTIFTSDEGTSIRTRVVAPRGLLLDCSMRSKNGFGWSQWSDTKRIRTSGRAPQPPTGVEVESVNAINNGAKVVASRPAQRNGGTMTGYQARCENGDTVRTSEPKTGRTFRLTDLTPGVRWDCSVRGRNSTGWSEWSTSEPVTPIPPAG